MSKITFPGSAGGGGGGVSDHGGLAGLADDDHTQYLLRSDFASSGAAQKPTTSGTVVGAGDQIYISGIAIGPMLGGGGVTDHGALAGLADDDHTQYMLVDGSRAFTGTGSGEASFGVATELYVSGVAVGHYLSTAAAAADLSAVAEDILVVTSGAHSVGSFTKVWGSGFYDGIVLADNDPAGTFWKITVDSAGTLTTTQVS